MNQSHDTSIKTITFEESDIRALRAIAINPIVGGIPSYVKTRLVEKYGAVRVEDVFDERGRPTFFAYHLTDVGVKVLDIADRTGHNFVTLPVESD